MIKLDPKIAVEIGTYRGISTVVLASVCDIVCTFDVLYQPDTLIVLDLFDIRNVNYVYKSKKKFVEITDKDYLNLSLRYGRRIREHISKLDFDLGFIDGYHNLYEEVQKDFEAVKKCGTVLFHDYRKDFPETIKFCDSIGCEPLGEFALWQK